MKSIVQILPVFPKIKSENKETRKIWARNDDFVAAKRRKSTKNTITTTNKQDEPDN